MIKSVIFDIDGVLLNSFEDNLKFYQDLLIYTGYNPPTKEVFSHMFHMTMKDVIRILTNSKNENEVEKLWLMAKTRIVRYPSELITVPKKLDSVIKKLAKKYILAIVTSRISGGVFSLPQLSMYEKYFKTTVYYEDTVKHKPDPEPLFLVIKRLKVKADETVYIGDALTDIQAANLANIKSIAFSKQRLGGCDARTSVFGKIPKLVSDLN